MHNLTLKLWRQGPRVTLPGINPNRHPRLAQDTARTLKKPVGFIVSSHALGLADEPNAFYDPDEPERFCLGLCDTLQQLPFHAQTPWVFL
jgi:hypothetical protein